MILKHYQIVEIVILVYTTMNLSGTTLSENLVSNVLLFPFKYIKCFMA